MSIAIVYWMDLFKGTSFASLTTLFIESPSFEKLEPFIPIIAFLSFKRSDNLLNPFSESTVFNCTDGLLIFILAK